MELNKYDSVEATLLLESLVKKRTEKLESISREQLMDLERGTYIQPKELVDIVYDNAVTEAYMDRFFGQGLLAMPTQVEELHFKWCENSGVTECICLAAKITRPDKPI
jgi:hypothetical protein